MRLGGVRETPSPQWLERRVDLWRRFCLPSIAAQTVTGFTWLLLCDESTDSSVLAVLRACAREVPALEIAITGSDRSLRDAVRSRVDPGTDILVTTWLDSDDAVADRFVETIQAYAEPFARSAHRTLLVGFPRGYRLDVASGELYEDWMASGPFPSLFERPQAYPVESVFSAGHVMLPHLHQTHRDESLRAWLIAVHGDNLVNRIGALSHRAAPVFHETIPGFPPSVISPAPRTGA